MELDTKIKKPELDVVDKFFNNDYLPFSFLQENFNVVNKTSFYPNVRDDENYTYLEYSMPGVEKNNIDLSVENNMLHLRVNQEDNYENYNRVSWTTQKIDQSFPISKEKYDVDNIESEYKNGILNIKIPKINNEENENNKNRKKIEIH